MLKVVLFLNLKVLMEAGCLVKKMTENSSYSIVVTTLCKRLREEIEPEIRISIIRALQEIGNEDAIFSLTLALEDKNSNVRQAAIEAIKSSQIVKVHFLSYLKELFQSKETIQSILQEESINDRVMKTLLAFERRLITMENNPKVQQNIYGNVGNNAGTVGGDFTVTGNFNFNDETSLTNIAQELEQIFDKIISKNLVEAQESAKEAVNRFPALTNPRAIELAGSNHPTLQVRLQSAIAAMGIETVKVIFAPAGIPIEGIKAWRNPGQ